MKKNKKYYGVIIPAVTPLTADHKLDKPAVKKIFDSFYKYNVSPFILGTTGESASLPAELKTEYIKEAGKNKKPGTVLYAGISSNVLSESVEFSKLCADNGVDAVAATLPYYFPLTESQMKKHFEYLANNIPLPLIIYNIPATIHMSIPLPIIDELSHHPNVIATKDSERNEERLKQSLELWKDRDDFGHFLGWSAKSVEALINGSDGLIPSTGNIIPEIYSEMLEAVESGDHQKAYEMQKLSDIYGSVYQSGRTLGESIWALKLLMKEKGLCEAVVMPPLQSSSKEEETKLIQAMKELKDKVA
ncbi:MAG TPA: dihydrodipicolinate synthase family protein [Chitinophagaceae bacterium]|nr:dihydrodipicolinate synthase family protein [Chitinophagaceae bacterium]